jgi:drug/metabolite transporter (DMT)-like permease
LASGIVLSMESFEATKMQIHNPLGLLLVLATIICWGTATVAGRALMTEMPLEVAAPARMIFGSFATLGIVAFNGHYHVMAGQLPLLTHGPILSEYLKLVLIAGFTPVFFYFYGLKYTSAVAGTFCEMFQTVAALLVTWGFMGQALAAHQVVAGIVLMAAVARISILQGRAFPANSTI